MSKSKVIRADIQALRAFAVLMVVIFHLWPNRLTGGFAGVDVFFVISGFLISGSLFSEIQAAKRIRLASFWARRIRRLLPAALAVIALTSAFSTLVVPAFTRQGFFAEAIASTFYFENWQLVATSTNYFAAAASPFQHYWSLAVEEQFYLVWPLLLTLLVGIAGRKYPRLLRSVLFVSIITSFGYSLFASYSQPSLGYFTTFGRVWEFGLGAAIAFGGHRLRFTKSGRSILSLSGFALILGSAVLLNERMTFPGWFALLPALGAATVILAGLQGLPAWLESLYRFKPISFTGEISYSLYLWHWPLIILLPWATGYQPRAYELLLVLSGSFVLAYLSKKFIEDRFRTAANLVQRKPRATFLFGAAISIAVLIISLIGAGVTSAQMAAAGAEVQTLDRAKNDTADPNHQCMTDPESTDVKICRFGRIGADYRVLIVGDSHAAMHLGAWRLLADRGQFEVDLAYKASCSFNLETRNDSPRGRSCEEWNQALQRQLAKEKPYDLVLTSYYTAVRATELDGNHDRATVAGFKAAWAPLQARNATVVAIRDGVNMDKPMRDCWESAVYDASKCKMAESDAFVTDLAQRAASSPPGALTLDFTDLYCQNGTCPAKIDGTYVYRDNSHISLLFSQKMAPQWYHRLTQLGVKMPVVAGLSD